MSADGEINVAVKAEGVDEAAAEIGNGGAGAPTGGGEGGLGTAIRGGVVGGVLSQALGPLLDVLDPILKLMQAFLAPVGALLLRLLQPVLRLFLQLLPGWLSFISSIPGLVGDAVEFIQSLPGRIWNFVSSLPADIWAEISSGASWLTRSIQSIGMDIGTGIWRIFKNGADWLINLPSKLASALKGLGVRIIGGAADLINESADDGILGGLAGGLLVPNIPTFGLGASSTGAIGGVSASQLARQNQQQPVQITLTGGLESLVERVERDTAVNLP